MTSKLIVRAASLLYDFQKYRLNNGGSELEWRPRLLNQTFPLVLRRRRRKEMTAEKDWVISQLQIPLNLIL